MAWYLNPALTRLRAEVNARWPNRDRRSDGTIGDAAHRASVSDHNPDPDGTVDAWDMDIDGVDVWAIIDQFEEHPAARYWIYNRRIATRDNRWRRERYHGDNPHDKHVHFNTRDGYQNSTKPWGVHPPEDDMTPDQLADALLNPTVAARMRAIAWQYQGGGIPQGMSTLGVLNETLLTSRAVLAAVKGASSDTIVAEIRAQAEQTRGALLAAVTEQAPALAAAVAQRLDQEVSETQIGEAIARELANLLATSADQPASE